MRRMLRILVLVSLVTLVSGPAHAHPFESAELIAPQRLFSLLQQPFEWIWRTVMKTGSEFDPYGREAPTPGAETDVGAPEVRTEPGSEFDPDGTP